MVSALLQDTEQEALAAIAEGLRNALVSRNLPNYEISHLKQVALLWQRDRDTLVSRNSATTKYPYRMALFA